MGSAPAAPVYTAADYTDALGHHLPFGPVWPREPGSVLGRVLVGLASTYARVSSRGGALLQDSPAGELDEMLTDWEATVGLPDPCAGPDATIAQRRAHVVAKVGARGGQSIPYFVAYAAALGFAATFGEFAPARADVLCADDQVFDPDYAHLLQLTASGITQTYFSADQSYADEPLAAWGNAVLECELRRVAPAHVILTFAYVGDLVPRAWDTPGAGWSA